MAKALTIMALSMAMVLCLMNTAHAAKAAKPKNDSITGYVIQVSKTVLVVGTQGDNGKVKQVILQLTSDTTYTGGELVKDANVTVTAKGGKAISVDVPVAKK